MQQQGLRNLWGKELLGFLFWLRMEEALLQKPWGSCLDALGELRPGWTHEEGSGGHLAPSPPSQVPLLL